MTVIATETLRTRLVGTEEGFERVAASPQLLELLGQFCVADAKQEACFSDALSIGMGYNSEVREVDGMAVKLSTDTTGRSAWLWGTSKPENLLNQFRFMDTLVTYFGSNTEVIAPDQYIALRTQSGAYLSVQQYMGGWQPLQFWLNTQGSQDASILAGVKDRIKRNVDSPLLRLGLEDLGLHQRQMLHTKNILLPPDTGRIDEAQLCIIDQPSQGLCGRLVVAGIRIATGTHAAFLPHPLAAAV